MLSDAEALTEKARREATKGWDPRWVPFAVGVESARDLLVVEGGKVLDVRGDAGTPVAVALTLEEYLTWHARGIASGEIAELNDGSLALLSQLESRFEWNEREIAPGATAAMLEAEG